MPSVVLFIDDLQRAQHTAQLEPQVELLEGLRAPGLLFEAFRPGDWERLKKLAPETPVR